MACVPYLNPFGLLFRFKHQHGWVEADDFCVQLRPGRLVKDSAVLTYHDMRRKNRNIKIYRTIMTWGGGKNMKILYEKRSGFNARPPRIDS